MLRAGPFSDERVRRLGNRRFVPFAFDLVENGALADADASRFLVKRRPEFGGRIIRNEPLMILTPDGENLGETIRYDSTREVLRIMRRALRKRPEFNRAGPDEKEKETAVERAQILIDLLDMQGARKVLEHEKEEDRTDAAHYLLGHLARLRRDWEGMEVHLRKVRDKALAADVRMERAHRLWQEREYEELRAALADFPKQSHRYSEARYHLGLAHYHLGRRKEAMKIWKEMILSRPQDPWIYRADWAYTNIKDGVRGGRLITGAGTGNSPLGRIGYMGGRNPDLRGPQR